MNVAGDVRLVAAIRNRPLIWDGNDPAFRVKPLKRQAWEEVARETNRSVDDVKSRWRNIKDYRAKKLSLATQDYGTIAMDGSADSFLSFLDRTLAQKRVLRNMFNSVVTSVSHSAPPCVPETCTSEPLKIENVSSSLSDTVIEAQGSDLAAFAESPSLSPAPQVPTYLSSTAQASVPHSSVTAAVPGTSPSVTADRPVRRPRLSASAKRQSMDTSDVPSEAVESPPTSKGSHLSEQDADILFGNAIVAELKKQSAGENLRMKADICQIVFAGKRFG